MLINSRMDLEALRGTDQWPDALRMLAGATIGWHNTAADGEASVWEQVEDTTVLDRLGMTLAELQAELVAAGIVIDPPQAPPIVTPPPPPVPQFYARDLLALFTDDDQIKIEEAVKQSVTLRRIWTALPAQGDEPIMATSERAIAGWAGLTAALGTARVVELQTALGI